MNCRACESEDFKKEFMKKGKWLGAYKYELDKYGDLFEKREFSLGTDYYPSVDLLHLTCRECGCEDYRKVEK